MRVETKGADGFVMREGCLQQRLPHGITSLDDLVGREETLHAVIGNTYLLRFLCQQLIGDASIRVLFLYQARDSHRGSLVKGGTTGIASYTHSYLRTELLDNLLSHALTLPYLIENLDILEQVLAVKTADGETFDLIASGGDTLHLHPS